jgi:hypothetical protein
LRNTPRREQVRKRDRSRREKRRKEIGQEENRSRRE